MASNTKNNLYEVIHVPPTTNVRFFTSVDPGSYVPSHWHRAVEIIYMQEGELTVTVDNHSHLIQKGECIIVNANVMHSTKCTSPNTAIVFQIPLSFMETYIPDVEQYLFLWDEQTSDPRKKTKHEIFKQTLEQMQIANDFRPKGFLLRFNSLLFEIMYQLYHNFSVKIFKSDVKRKNKELDRLNPILQYTSEHYNRTISIQEIADVAILQPGYFCRFFKKYMGTTFLEYQNELRLSHIYQDLITTQDSISTILERHGFTNYKLFRRMFYEHFGDTPLKIRKKGTLQKEISKNKDKDL